MEPLPFEKMIDPKTQAHEDAQGRRQRRGLRVRPPLHDPAGAARTSRTPSSWRGWPTSVKMTPEEFRERFGYLAKDRLRTNS